jgi:hypothetical protein
VFGRVREIEREKKGERERGERAGERKSEKV